MAISSPSLLPHFSSESRPPRDTVNLLSNEITCFIHTNHPLAFCLIKNAICSDPRLHSGIRPYSNDSTPLNGDRRQILVIDICSVENWAGCLNKWCSESGLTLALVSSEKRTCELELQMLYLGAAGVLTFSENLGDHLPRAIHAN